MPLRNGGCGLVVHTRSNLESLLPTRLIAETPAIQCVEIEVAKPVAEHKQEQQAQSKNYDLSSLVVQPRLVQDNEQAPDESMEPEPTHDEDILANPVLDDDASAACPHETALQCLLDELCIPGWLMDIFKRSPIDSLKHMLQAAKSRDLLHQVLLLRAVLGNCNRFSQTSCFPSSGAESFVNFTAFEPKKNLKVCIDEAMAALDGPVLVVLDGKHVGHGRQGHSPGIPLPVLRMALDCILEKNPDEEAIHFKEQNLLVVTDGRNQKTEQQVRKELANRVKGVKKSICKRKGTVTMRHLYHLREFSANGHMTLKSRRVLHAQLAEPLENIFVVRGRKCILPIVENRFVDTPGDSSNRSLSNL